MKIVLVLPTLNKWIGADDKFVDEKSDARIFDSIIAADAYSAYVELVYGVQCFAGLASS